MRQLQVPNPDNPMPNFPLQWLWHLPRKSIKPDRIVRFDFVFKICDYCYEDYMEKGGFYDSD